MRNAYITREIFFIKQNNIMLSRGKRETDTNSI